MLQPLSGISLCSGMRLDWAALALAKHAPALPDAADVDTALTTQVLHISESIYHNERRRRADRFGIMIVLFHIIIRSEKKQCVKNIVAVNGKTGFTC